ncbi:MAG: hypothetical protein ACPG61_17630 [Paracoccaceae bacterium]
MKRLALALAVVAAPAHAHHEVVVVSSILPVLGGLALITTAGVAALRRWLRENA